jgi:hypothetical protein
VKPEATALATSAPGSDGKEMAYPRPKHTPHPRLPQYTVEEVERGVEVIELLRKVRDRCRSQGLIGW